MSSFLFDQRTGPFGLFNSTFNLASSGTSLSSLAPEKNTTGLPTPTVKSSNSDSGLPSLELEQGPQRYAAYAMRLKTLIVSSSRYIAYSSDIGEAFRPLTRPEVVRAAYGISWLYLLGDVGYAGYKAAKQHETLAGEKGLGLEVNDVVKKAEEKLGYGGAELRKRADAQEAQRQGLDVQKHGEGMHVGLIMARRAVFQGLASMALPAFTIHSIVRYTAPLFAKSSRPRVRATGPTVAGLLFVPALPFLFDEPVEHAVDLAFDWLQETFLSPSASKNRSAVVEAVKEKVE